MSKRMEETGFFRKDTGFSCELISTGSFHDQEYEITVNVIRLSPEAVNACWEAEREDRHVEDFEDYDDYEEYLEGKDADKEAFAQKVFGLFGEVKDGTHCSGCVTNNVSEIFTVVMMKPIGEGEVREYRNTYSSEDGIIVEMGVRGERLDPKNKKKMLSFIAQSSHKFYLEVAGINNML